MMWYRRKTMNGAWTDWEDASFLRTERGYQYECTSYPPPSTPPFEPGLFHSTRKFMGTPDASLVYWFDEAPPEGWARCP